MGVRVGDCSSRPHQRGGSEQSAARRLLDAWSVFWMRQFRAELNCCFFFCWKEEAFYWSIFCYDQRDEWVEWKMCYDTIFGVSTGKEKWDFVENEKSFYFQMRMVLPGHVRHETLIYLSKLQIHGAGDPIAMYMLQCMLKSWNTMLLEKFSL